MESPEADQEYFQLTGLPFASWNIDRDYDDQVPSPQTIYVPLDSEVQTNSDRAVGQSIAADMPFDSWSVDSTVPHAQPSPPFLFIEFDYDDASSEDDDPVPIHSRQLKYSDTNTKSGSLSDVNSTLLLSQSDLAYGPLEDRATTRMPSTLDYHQLPGISHNIDKTKADHNPYTADVTEKHLRKKAIREKARFRKKEDVDMLIDAYYSLPGEYRRKLNQSVGKQEGQRIHLTDILLCAALALEDLKHKVSHSGAVSEEARLREQEDLVSIDERAILDMDVIDPIPTSERLYESPIEGENRARKRDVINKLVESAGKRPANSRRGYKTKADRDPLTADVSEKRLHERGIEGKSRAKKKEGVNKLIDAYSSLPEYYRQMLDQRVNDWRRGETQNLAQADVFLRIASALEELNGMLLSGACAAPDEMGPREQEDPMPTDEQAILNLNMDVIDPVPAPPDPSLSFFNDPNLWMHGPVGSHVPHINSRKCG